MNDSHPPTAQSPDSPRRRRSSWIIWLWFWITVGIVAIVQIPQEITAWKYAAALEAREAGENERSRELLAAVLKQDPAEHIFRTMKFQWDEEEGRYGEALEFLNEQLKRQPDNAGLIQARGQLYLRMRQYPEAIADAHHVQQIAVATGRIDRDEAANALAYARALGKSELDLAIAGIEGPVRNARAELKEDLAELQAEQTKRKTSFWTSLLVAERKLRLAMVLDTRGFAELQRGNSERALADLEEAVQLGQDHWNFRQQHSREFSSQKRSVREWEKELESRRHMLAVIFYHRGLAREKIGREAEARQDFSRVRELIGKEPDESLF